MINKTTFLKFFLLASICFLSFSVYTYTNTPPAANAGEPGGNNCTSCHSGSVVTGGTSWDAIVLTGFSSSSYTPGTTYNVTIDGAAAATAKNGFQITALNSSNAAAGTFAAGTGTTILSSGGKSYVTHSGSNAASWTFNWTAPSMGVGAVTFYASYNASNSNSNSGGDVVYTKSFTINQTTVNLPTAVITSNKNTICIGDTLYLTGSGINNPTTYSWQFLNNTPSTKTGQSTFVIYNSIGNKTIRLTTSNSNGNSVPAQKIILVVANPTASITATSQTICGSDSISLQAVTDNGTSYLWTPSNLTTSSIFIKDSLSYMVKVTNVNGCFASSSAVKVPKVSYPQANLITSKDTICKSDSVLFELVQNGFLTSYFINDTAVVTNSPNTTYSLKRNEGIYKVNVQIAKQGCITNLPEKIITVQKQADAPLVSCGANTTSSMEFTWLKVGDNNNYEVSTNNGTNWINANGANQLAHKILAIAPNANITILIRAKSVGPCGPGLTTTKSCINSGCNKINSVFLFKKSICISNVLNSTIATLEINNISTQNYLIQLESDSFSNTFGRNKNFAFAIKKGNNNIRIKIKDTTEIGCPILDSTILILGNSNPVLPIFTTNSSNNTFCKNEDILINAAKDNLPNTFNYYRTFPERVLLLSSSNNEVNLKSNFLEAVNTKLRIVAVNIANLCADSSQDVSITINPIPSANFSFEYAKSDSNNINKNRAIFTNTSSDSSTFNWYFGDSAKTTSTNKNTTFTYPKSGNFNVKLLATNNYNCKDSVTKQITILNTSVTNLAKEFNLKVYPNPANDFVVIELLNNIENGTFSVFDINGKLMEKENLAKWQSINTLNYTSGMYLIKFDLETKIIYQKFIKN